MVLFNYNKKINFLLLVIIFLSFLLAINCNNEDYSYDDIEDDADDDEDETVEHDDKIPALIRLLRNETIECPNLLNKSYNFKYLIHNKSVLLSDIYQFEKNDFQKYFDLKQVDVYSTSALDIENAQYNNSGRYYCIYEKFNDSTKSLFMLKTFTVFVYDLEDKYAHVGETVTLKHRNFNDNSLTKNDLRWLFNNELLFNGYKKMNEYYSLSNNNDLVIQLDDNSLFGVYSIQNTINGALVIFRVVCHGPKCSEKQNTRGSEPIITPFNPTVNAGSSILLQCDNPSYDVHPDNYWWYKYKDMKENDLNETENEEYSELIYSGHNFYKENLTESDQGWYGCCLVFYKNNKNDSAHEYENEEAEVEETLNADRICTTFYMTIKPQDKPSLIRADAKRQNEHKSWIAILVSTIVITVLLLLVIFAIYLYKKLTKRYYPTECSKYFNENQLYQTSAENTHDTALSNINELTSSLHTESFASIQTLLLKDNEAQKYKIPIDDLKFGHILGKGAFGIVIYAEIYKENDDKLTSKTPVAIKKLRDNATSHNLSDMFKELKCMLEVGHHQNIINLVGYSIDSKSLYIVTEYVKYGNLKEYLRKYDGKKEKKIEASMLLLYSYQIAKGMEYLHMKKVLHRDLAARNILVAEEDLVKIADFGLARNIRSDYYYKQQADGFFPIKWMAPEALTYNKITKESDVWSYGIVLWEIYTYGHTPYPSIPPENTLKLITSGYRLEKPDDCDEEIYKLMSSCWQMNIEDRPKFSQLVKIFEQQFNLKESNDVYCYNINHNVSNTEINITTSLDTKSNNSENNSDENSNLKYTDSLQNSSPCTSSLISSSCSYEDSDCDMQISNKRILASNEDDDECDDGDDCENEFSHRNEVNNNECKPFLLNQYYNGNNSIFNKNDEKKIKIKKTDTVVVIENKTDFKNLFVKKIANSFKV